MKFNSEDYPTHNFIIGRVAYTHIKSATCSRCNLYLEYSNAGEITYKDLTVYCEGKLRNIGGSMNYDIELEINNPNQVMTCNEKLIKNLLEWLSI